MTRGSRAQASSRSSAVAARRGPCTGVPDVSGLSEADSAIPFEARPLGSAPEHARLVEASAAHTTTLIDLETIALLLVTGSWRALAPECSFQLPPRVFTCRARNHPPTP